VGGLHPGQSSCKCAGLLAPSLQRPCPCQCSPGRKQQCACTCAPRPDQPHLMQSMAPSGGSGDRPALLPPAQGVPKPRGWPLNATYPDVLSSALPPLCSCSLVGVNDGFPGGDAGRGPCCCGQVWWQHQPPQALPLPPARGLTGPPLTQLGRICCSTALPACPGSAG
jgi:hypothetical protein